MKRALLLAILAVAGCGPDPEGMDASVDAGELASLDSDGDTISDLQEESERRIDTDGDGTPDYLDADSDGDGVEDSVEAGDADLLTAPVDSDDDGAPDFRDLDSDDNGILDGIEGTEDADLDGLEDFRDLDDDDDRLDDVVELQGLPRTPPDSDGDGDPDFRDPDSDDDLILDGDEGTIDTDGDGLLDRFDLDSDADTLPDLLEAGDEDLYSPPVNSDDDLLPDYRDPDSDDDGLADDVELDLGTDPTEADSDGDGVTDLIEFAAGTDPLDASDDPRRNGDFVFVVPFEEAADPPRDTLAFRTSIRSADVYFSFDTSTTMIQEMNAMRDPTTGVPAILDSLLCATTTSPCAADGDCATGEICGSSGTCQEDPAIDGCLTDLWTGVGSWHHVDSYTNLLSVQPSPLATAGAIPTAPDFWVAPLQAPACAADPANCTNAPGCATSGVGCPGFRSDAVRIYVQITDANDECRCGVGTSFPCSATGPARCMGFTTAFAGGELARQGIRFIGLIGAGPAYGDGDATTLAQEIGLASGTVDSSTGMPFVYPATDALVVSRTVDAVRDIVTGSAFDITIDATDEMGDAGDALQFIERLEVNTTGAGCFNAPMTRDVDGDGFDDAFDALRPGNQVCWDVVVRDNDAVEPAREPQVFRARLRVFADGSEVDARTVYFLVPAEVEIMLPD